MIENRWLLFFIVLTITVVQSLHIFASAYYSIVGYDIGKVMSFLELSPGLIAYIKKLQYGQGIPTQVYLLNVFVDVTPRILKLISYSFFILTFAATVFVANQVRGFPISGKNLIVTASSSFIFFSSNLLQYLGSYGMLVYCQSFFFGVLLLYFSTQYLWTQKKIELPNALYWLLVFVFATYVDVRNSFYICIALVTVLIFAWGNWRLFKQRVLVGTVLGVFLLLPIASQFYFKSDGFTQYRPNHVLSLYFTQEFSAAAILNYMYDNGRTLIVTMLGPRISHHLVFGVFFTLGVLSTFNSPGKRSIFLFLVLTLTVQFIASLADIYPFGSIRYCAPLLAIFLFYFYSGVAYAFSVLDAWVRYRVPQAALVSLLFALSIWLSWPLVDKVSGAAKRVYDRETMLITALSSVERENVWCDVASEKVAMAHRIKCQIIGKWNYQTGKPESDEFYAEVENKIAASRGALGLFLISPLEIPYFDPIRHILSSNSLVESKQLHGRNHLYIFERSMR